MDPWDYLRFIAYQEQLKDVQRAAEQERLANSPRLNKPISESLPARATGYLRSLFIKRTFLFMKRPLMPPDVCCQVCD